MANEEFKPDTIPIAELAKRLSISEAKAYELAAANEFPFPVIRLGGRILVSRKAYVEWMSQFDYKPDLGWDPPSEEN